MKKALVAALAAVVLAAAALSVFVGARSLTADEKALIEKLNTKIEVADGSFMLPPEAVMQAENYLASSDTPLTAEQASAIAAQFDAAVAVVKKEDTGEASGWSFAAKKEILTCVKTAAGVLNLSVVVDVAQKAAVLRDGQGATLSVNDQLFMVTGDAVPGDLNGDTLVTAADAIYLLYHRLFGEVRYPVSQPADFTNDGNVTAADAIYLLYHTLFGAERYPLAPPPSKSSLVR